ncbi:tetratricopeptide repeat protein [Polynucleobacter sp. MWH-Aus1W21]|jgi:TPR repeat protein|uniref:tetratricopeptide repeat protein n=1 Tax=Polynucleobacter sp. MWH-Aus1W21 TaxID=1855880 RepID=UPI001BFD952A|nr:tetratricopeptide repeat protein [Polynucleobacter sp. MWH-Aus1W21]QWD65707.1 sel1 repeat family protein [Polynucleobacter sp. MWH-Aus1W21]
MGYGAIELGQLNISKGKYEVAFDILYDCAVNDQNDDALFLLTKMTFDGHLEAEQMEKFYELQNGQTSLGNGYALFNVGLMHERGLGKVPQSYKVAVEYYQKAVKQEVKDAYCNLGNIYALGLGMDQGVPRNVELGVKLLTMGAEEGSRQCAYTLGSLYGKGEFIPLDLKKSFYYLSLAALAGHDQAKRVLHVFVHAHKENYDAEMDAAQLMYGKIENLRQLYKCL